MNMNKIMCTLELLTALDAFFWKNQHNAPN